MHAILKKKYGQNFLIDKNILHKISNLIPKKNLNIIEIGPGDGRLTEYIINFKPKKFELIEIDTDLIPILKSKFYEYKNVKITNADILNHQISSKVDLIISNLPYNISSQILVKICKMNYKPEKLILMFQKEFAQRLMDKKLNSINSLVNCNYRVISNFNVSKNSFKPIPKVESTVLSFTLLKKALLNINEVDKFIEFKRNLFSHKRKTLKNLLRNHSFDKEKYDLSKRVEHISLKELLDIFREINI